jgi:hypothetical protein
MICTKPLVTLSFGPKSGLHFWDPSDAPPFELRIVGHGKPDPLFRTMH